MSCRLLAPPWLPRLLHLLCTQEAAGQRKWTARLLFNHGISVCRAYGCCDVPVFYRSGTKDCGVFQQASHGMLRTQLAKLQQARPESAAAWPWLNRLIGHSSSRAICCCCLSQVPTYENIPPLITPLLRLPYALCCADFPFPDAEVSVRNCQGIHAKVHSGCRQAQGGWALCSKNVSLPGKAWCVGKSLSSGTLASGGGTWCSAPTGIAGCEPQEQMLGSQQCCSSCCGRRPSWSAWSPIQITLPTLRGTQRREFLLV